MSRACAQSPFGTSLASRRRAARSSAIRIRQYCMKTPLPSHLVFLNGIRVPRHARCRVHAAGTRVTDRRAKSGRVAEQESWHGTPSTTASTSACSSAHVCCSRRFCLQNMYQYGCQKIGLYCDTLRGQVASKHSRAERGASPAAAGVRHAHRPQDGRGGRASMWARRRPCSQAARV